MWIFPWIKLSWHPCSMWEQLGWLNWFWQFLCEGLFSFKPKGFYYSCMVLQFMGRKDFLLHKANSRKLILMYVFKWLYLTQCLTSFSSINHVLGLYAQFLMLFHLTYMRFSQWTYLLSLSLHGMKRLPPIIQGFRVSPFSLSVS